jgi:hypothetical protein
MNNSFKKLIRNIRKKEYEKIRFIRNMELREAKCKDVYPYWVVFYLRNPEDFSQVILDLGNGSIDEGRKIYQGTDYDDGFGFKKYWSIKQGSKLLKSGRLK